MSVSADILTLSGPDGGSLSFSLVSGNEGGPLIYDAYRQQYVRSRHSREAVNTELDWMPDHVRMTF